jgi:hypothetical protein
MLGPGTRVAVDTTAVGETGTVGNQACLSVFAPDGEGTALVHWTATVNFSPPLYFESSYLPTGGAPLGTYAGSTHDAAWAFPLAGGWVEARSTGGAPSGYVVFPLTRSLDEQDGGLLLTGASPYSFSSVPGGGAVAYRAVAMQEGGSLCPPGPPAVQQRIVINRWDTQGAKGPNGDLGCHPDDTSGSIAGNSRGDVLAIFGGQRWHLAPDGGLSHVPAGQTTGFIPLIGGVFAEHAAGWNVVDADGTFISPGPDWLATSADPGQVDIVLGGGAYVLHHFATDDCGKALELILEDGTRCGFLDVQGPDKCPSGTLTVGIDGTVTALDRASCTLFLWKGVLGPASGP